MADDRVHYRLSLQAAADFGMYGYQLASTMDPTEMVDLAQVLRDSGVPYEIIGGSDEQQG